MYKMLELVDNISGNLKDLERLINEINEENIISAKKTQEEFEEIKKFLQNYRDKTKLQKSK